MGAVGGWHVVRGTVAGAVAFFVGIAVALLTARPSEGDDLFRISSGSASRTVQWYDTSAAPADWKVAGWQYHEAHFASVDVSMDIENAPAVDALEATSAMDPTLLLHATPVMLLIGAGLFAAAGSSVSPVAGILRGGLVTLGYLPPALLSVFLLGWENGGRVAGLQGSVSAHPELLTGVLLTGIAFPVVFGAAGGVIASALSR